MVWPVLIKSVKGTYLIRKKINEVIFFLGCLKKFNQGLLVILTIFSGVLVYYYLDIPIDVVTMNRFSNVIFLIKKDSSILELIAFTTNIIAFSIPLSAPFYYFSYKEQKTLSESSLNVNSSPFFHFGIVTIVIFIIGKHLQLLMGNTIDNSLITFENTAIYIGKIFFFFFIILLYVWRVWKLVNYYLNRINVSNFLERIIEDVSDTIELLFQGSNYLEKRIYKHTLIQIYSKLNFAVEGTYQLLLQTISKDMIGVYHIKYSSWSKVITLFFIGGYVRAQEGVQILREDSRANLLLLNENPDGYSMMYRNILKNHLSLIMALYGKNKIQEGNLAIKDFFKLSPEGDVAYDEINVRFRLNYDKIMLDYLTNISELSLFLYKIDHVNIYPIIEEIKSLPIFRIGAKHIICIFRILIIKIIEKNDVKMLFHLVYALMDLKDIHILQRSKRTIKKINSRTVTLKEQMKLRIVKTLQQSMSNSDDESDDINGMCMYVLLNAALKSIEISHYACAGFIIKYLVSNFPSDILNRSYQKLLINMGNDSKLDEHELGASLGIRSFNINKMTAQYCLEKLTILIYGQQKFIKDNNVKVNQIPIKFISINNIELTNKKYLFKKFESSKIKYGLIYLEDKLFMINLESELNWQSLVISGAKKNVLEPD